MIAVLLRSSLWIQGICLLVLAGVMAFARQAEPQSAGIAFLSSTDHRNLYLYFVSFDGSILRQLHHAPLILQDLAWSPDGKWIVFSKRISAEQTNLYRTTANGKNAEQLTFTTGHHTSPAWSPDSQILAFQLYHGTSDAFVYRMSLNDFQEEQLTQEYGQGFHPTWSPDGQVIVYAAQLLGDNLQFYRMNPDGSDASPLFYAYQGVTAWSPDSRFLVFTVHASSGSDFEIYRTEIDSKRTIRLTAEEGADTMPAWSPDGEWIAFTSSRRGNSEIYRMRPDGSQQEALTDNGVENLSPIWSPDGKWIAYISNRNGTWDIYRMRPDGSQQTRMTNFPGNDLNPMWSPIIDLPWRWWLQIALALGMLAAAYGIKYKPYRTRIG